MKHPKCKVWGKIPYFEYADFPHALKCRICGQLTSAVVCEDCLRLKGIRTLLKNKGEGNADSL